MEGEEKTVSVDVDEAFIIKSDAGDLCRLCANTDNQLIPIFKGEGIEHNIPTKIEKHLPIIKVTEIDKLPLQICYQCASTLIAWHNLYEGCLIADKRLREILSISEKGFQEDDTFDNYVDDYRDDYDDQSRSNFDTLPLNSAPSTSNLAGDDLLKSNSIEISQLSESKEPNETELDNTDERTAVVLTADDEKPSNHTGGDGDDSIFYKCAKCTKVFLKRHNYQRHVRAMCAAKSKFRATKSPSEEEVAANELTGKCERVVINGLNFFKCADCAFVSKTVNAKMLRHLKKHEIPRIFSCETCGHQFREKYALMKHIKRQHENDRKFACDTCHCMFFDRFHLENHMRRHTGERPFVCDECGKAFAQGSSLFVHKKFHVGERSNICQLCGKGFVTNSGLLVHIRRHTGERKHACSHCDKTFVSTSQLKSHVVVHFDERPFSCSECGAQFKLRKHLKVHCDSHSQNKKKAR